MALQVFLAFIGGLLGCSIVLAVVVKNLAEGIAVSGKKPLLYGSGAAIITSLVAYLASYASDNPFNVFWIFGCIFFLFGLVHILFMHKLFFYSNKYNSNKVLIAELLFSLSLILFTIVVFSALQYFFKDKNFLFYPVVISTLLFFVPVLVYHSFQAAYGIPAARFPVWQYPLHGSEELPDISDNDRVLIIAFEVAERASDSRKIYFRVRAPETWQLGSLFYRFLNEYNNPENKTAIEYTDKEDNPYEWWFYKKPKWYQVRQIVHPEFSIRESDIRENTIIVCERLLNTTPVLNKHNNPYAR